MANASNRVKGVKKAGRSKRKSEGRVKPLSQFVRGKITAENYFSQTGQTVKRK